MNDTAYPGVPDEETVPDGLSGSEPGLKIRFAGFCNHCLRPVHYGPGLPGLITHRHRPPAFFCCDDCLREWTENEVLERHRYIHDVLRGGEPRDLPRGYSGLPWKAARDGFWPIPDFRDRGWQRWLAIALDITMPLPASASPIEKQFWEAHRYLALPDLDGLVFQHPAYGYRLDFALPDDLIGIELDGFRNHSKAEDIARDHRRQRRLETAGWRLIRFGGSEVHNDADSCVRETASSVRKIWESHD